MVCKRGNLRARTSSLKQAKKKENVVMLVVVGALLFMVVAAGTLVGIWEARLGGGRGSKSLVTHEMQMRGGFIKYLWPKASEKQIGGRSGANKKQNTESAAHQLMFLTCLKHWWMVAYKSRMTFTRTRTAQMTSEWLVNDANEWQTTIFIYLHLICFPRAHGITVTVTGVVVVMRDSGGWSLIDNYEDDDKDEDKDCEGREEKGNGHDDSNRTGEGDSDGDSNGSSNDED